MQQRLSAHCYNLKSWLNSKQIWYQILVDDINDNDNNNNDDDYLKKCKAYRKKEKGR